MEPFPELGFERHFTTEVNVLDLPLEGSIQFGCLLDSEQGNPVTLVTFLLEPKTETITLPAPWVRRGARVTARMMRLSIINEGIAEAVIVLPVWRLQEGRHVGLERRYFPGGMSSGARQALNNAIELGTLQVRIPITGRGASDDRME